MVQLPNAPGDSHKPIIGVLLLFAFVGEATLYVADADDAPTAGAQAKRLTRKRQRSLNG